MNEMLMSITVFILLVIVHELGHYITARLFKWKAKFGIRRRGILSGPGVLIKEDIEINSGKELSLLCSKLIIFSASGSLCILVPIIFSYLLDINFDSLIILALCYSIAETISTDFTFFEKFPESAFATNSSKEGPE